MATLTKQSSAKKKTPKRISNKEYGEKLTRRASGVLTPRQKYLQLPTIAPDDGVRFTDAYKTQPGNWSASSEVAYAESEVHILSFNSTKIRQEMEKYASQQGEDFSSILASAAAHCEKGNLNPRIQSLTAQELEALAADDDDNQEDILS